MRKNNLNQRFIKEISRSKKDALMQSEVEAFSVDLDTYNIRKGYLRSFKLFEEFSGTSIQETIRQRRENFNDSDSAARRRLAVRVEKEVESFYNWLRKVKNFRPNTAHYCSLSLKSVLLGLPIGVQVALCFGIILNDQANESADLLQ